MMPLKIVLALSDQQLVTGLSIMISAYSQLRCGLSFYHWRMVTTLAWFSSATHLATLLFLKQYLQRNTYIWYARVLLMTGLGVLLAAAIVPTGIPSEMMAFKAPAKCVFDAINPRAFLSRDYSISWYGIYMMNWDGISMVFSEIILLGGLSIRLLEMSTTIKRVSRGSLRILLGSIWRIPLVWSCEKLQQSPRLVRALFIPLTVFFLATLVSIQSILDLLGSDICGVGNTFLGT